MGHILLEHRPGSSNSSLSVSPAGRSAPQRPLYGAVLWLGCVALVLLLAGVSLAVGARAIPPDEVWRVLLRPDDGRESIIVWELRMPRTLLAVTVGMALAVAGVLMQALTRNPLAEPGLLGVNSGAALAVVISIAVLGVQGVTGWIWFSFAGSVLAATLVYTLGSGGRGGHQHIRLVLAGAALSACLGACTGILTMFHSEAFDSYRFWVVGSLDNRGTATASAILPFVAAGLVIALALGPALNAFALGDALSAGLGLRPSWIRGLGFTAVMLLCGAAAAAGPISFVGLVVPHVLRLLLGPDLRRLLLFALPAGPALLLLSDIAGRVVAPPGEIEAGIVTAFLGAPVLLWLVTRRRGATA